MIMFAFPWIISSPFPDMYSGSLALKKIRPKMCSLATIKMAVQYGTILGYDVVVWVLDCDVTEGASNQRWSKILIAKCIVF
jgi:hypothetical protein